MIKRFLLFVFAVLLFGCAATGKFYMKTVKSKNAQIKNTIRIAVIPENWYWLGTPNFLPRALITEFLDLGFQVVERSQLETIFRELKLDASGIVKDEDKKSIAPQGVNLGILDKTSIKKIGELLGVDAILVSYIVPTYSDGIAKATFRLVNTETAEVLFSITIINATEYPASTQLLIKSISSNIKQLLEGEEKILSEKNGSGDVIVQPQIVEIGDKDKSEKNEAKKLEEQEKLKIMKQYYSEAVEYYKAGEYEKAIQKLKENLKLDSHHLPSKDLLEKIKLKNQK